jgi:hypothetical protein
MRRIALFAAAGLVAWAGAAAGQLVPLTRCQAAFPCSVPYGLRPADAVAINGAFKTRLVAPHPSSDPAEEAARLYVRKNPLQPTPTPTLAPTAAPTAKSASAPKDLELP